MNPIHLPREMLELACFGHSGREWPFNKRGCSHARQNTRPRRRLSACHRESLALIAHERAGFDQARRLPDAIFDALADAGLFRLWLPEALGGPELSPLEFMTVVEAASALDGSVGWLVGNGGGMSRVGGYLPERIARDWFADPRAFIASATGAIGAAQKSNGGYRVSGRWPFGSGAHHATHFMALASQPGPDGRDEPSLCCYFQRRDVVVHDTWRVSGLRATGSCDFEVRDVFVPAEHTHPFIGHHAMQAGAVYQLPRSPCFLGRSPSCRSGLHGAQWMPLPGLHRARRGRARARFLAIERSSNPVSGGSWRCITRRALP
jgi:acyl-CoA dehydrogenase-like protein